jgi:hypothetical protein
MEKHEKDESSGLPVNGLLWVAILAAGGLFYFHQAPWKDSRPSELATPMYPIGAEQNIDARLWQDPIGAVARGRQDETHHKSKDSKGDRSEDLHKPSVLASGLCDRNSRTDSHPLIMGVMVLGGPYPEYAESRRRARYAVLAAMNEAGFAPESPEHIGYVVPENAWPGQRPEFIAYEWLGLREGAALTGASAPAVAAQTEPKSGRAEIERVLLLWLDSDVFWKDTNKKLVALANQLHPDAQCANLDSASRGLIVLGPGDSMMLRNLIRDPDLEAVKDDAPKLLFYDYAATADATRILNPGSKSPERVFFSHKNIVVYRTIGTDAGLAKALRDELVRRGAVAVPDPRAARKTVPRHVVILSEWDSLYGQTWPEQMAREFSGCADMTPACTMADIRRIAPWIHTYSYLRGLDGQLPVYQSSANSSTEAGSAPDKDESSGAASRRGEEKRIERPEGQSQLDYLRRLAASLAVLQRDLDHDHGETIGAIGVLGSDVYDKLLILEALRPLFPNAVFFTTDLDTRLLHPQQLQWTRNLLVASNFGLSLHPDLQADIAPFRDAYQTSLFLTTRIAIVNAARGDCGSENQFDCLPVDQSRIKRWLEPPRLFEIGRMGAFDLSVGPAGEAGSSAHLLPACKQLQDCNYIHSVPSPMYPTPSALSLRIGFSVLIIGVLVATAATGRAQHAIEWLRSGGRRHSNSARVLLAVTLGIALLLLGFFIPHIWSDLAGRLTRDDGMPITLLEGVSIWPTELIRVVAGGLAVWFLVRGWRSLNRNADDIATRMLWQPERAVLIDRVHRMCAHWPWWRKLLRMLSFRLNLPKADEVDPHTGLTPKAEAFWMAYIYQSRPWARFWRVTAATLLYLAFGIAVSFLFGFPQSPHRGEFALRANSVVTLISVFLMLALIFFVVDATALSALLIGKLRSDFPQADGSAPFLPSDGSKGLRWPQRTLDHFAAKLRINRRYVDQWIGMHFIARRTGAIVGLVYYPFIVLSLMVLARSSLFDNWTMPVALIIVFSVSFLIVIACAVVLRWSAEASRRKAIWRLTNEIIGLKGAGKDGERTAEQLQVMIEQIRNFQRGAFAPYSQQPVIRALMLPLGTYGGGALLQYLTLSNF